MTIDSGNSFTHTDMANLTPASPDKTLYIIGNGFDILHGVPSTYYHFRDSLGRNSEIRKALETYLTKEDLWADFEESLAHIDSGAMMNVVDNWLDAYDVFDSGERSADFFAAIESAVMPAQTIMNGLPEQFRQWVNSLQTNSMERPLENVLSREGRYLNFNYTEFLETLYGIPEKQILYLHGCRCNEKQELVLGHAPREDNLTGNTEGGKQSAAERAYVAADRPHGENLRQHIHSGRRRQIINDARETAAHYLAHYEDATTKKVNAVLKENQDFFNRQADVKDIIVIGHSLSHVDYPYFMELINTCEKNDSVKNDGVKWHISWYCADDLKRVNEFTAEVGLENRQIELFRIG